MNQIREIPLTQGKVTVVDAEDYDWLNSWKWYANRGRATFYAVRNIRKPNGKQALIAMHRLILATPKGMYSDHRNGDGLDNQRANLRICTNQENVQNQKLREDNTSGHKGVSWDVHNKHWRAQVRIDGKQVCLGYYDDIKEAVAAYRNKAKEVFGDFVREGAI